jgi:GAF domain-containing protein
MNLNPPEGMEAQPRGPKAPHRLGELLHRLLHLAHRGLARKEFLRQASQLLLDFSACDIVEIRIAEGARSQRCLAWIGEHTGIQFDCRELHPGDSDAGSDAISGPIPEPILEAVLNGRFAAVAPFLTRSGSFWTGDAARPILLRDKGGTPAGSHTIVIGGEYQSLALIPFTVDERSRGVLQLSSRRIDFFSKYDIQFHEAVAETLGVTLAHQAAQWALGERVKELTCLYRVGKATQAIDRPVEELLRDVVQWLPPGWQYPEIAHARIVYDGRSLTTSGFLESAWKQSADIVVHGITRGNVEIVYTVEKPPADEGPFLKEERNLINGIAETLGIALAFQNTQWALRERVKELTCLHSIAALAQRPDLSPPSLLPQIAALLPPAMQYPAITEARLLIEGVAYPAGQFEKPAALLTAPVFVGGHRRGLVEIAYTEPRREAEEGPFLKEERSLINEVARQVGLVLERWETDTEMLRLQEKLHTEAGFPRTLAEVEAEYMKSVLVSVYGNKSRAAEILGIDRKTLRKRLQETKPDST